jgi:hypothetical protein
MNEAGSGRLGKALAAMSRMATTSENARFLNGHTGNSEGSLEIVSTFLDKSHTIHRDRERIPGFKLRQAPVMFATQTVFYVLKGHDFSRAISTAESMLASAAEGCFPWTYP